MTTQTTKVNFTIDGIDAKVGHELLEDICQILKKIQKYLKNLL
jgi:hypothetical protein